jgi:hypothetical protein
VHACVHARLCACVCARACVASASLLLPVLCCAVHSIENTVYREHILYLLCVLSPALFFSCFVFFCAVMSRHNMYTHTHSHTHTHTLTHSLSLSLSLTHTHTHTHIYILHTHTHTHTHLARCPANPTNPTARRGGHGKQGAPLTHKKNPHKVSGHALSGLL